MFKIKTAKTYPKERKYIFDVILNDSLGIDFEHTTANQNFISMRLEEEEEESLFIADTFFQTPVNQWLTKESLPKKTLKQFDIPSELITRNNLSNKVPVIYGEEQNFSLGDDQQSKDAQWIPVDIFGSCFFMLSRYEECVIQQRDQHQRFFGNQSISYQEGFLLRPIVNEYINLLAAFIRKRWPQIKIKKHQYQFKLSCDVDQPFDDYLYSNRHVARRIAGDIVKRKAPKQAVLSLIDAYRLRKYGLAADKNYTFDWIMDTCEKANVKNAFYFITDHTCEKDGDYEFEDSRIQNLLKNIHARGHEIGLHGSYNAYINPKQLKKEFSILRSVCKSLDIEQERWGGRQHYLRWDVKRSWKIWETAGLDYDSSVGFSDQVGFRCGTCFPFHPFDWKTKTKINIEEIPLIVMEGTLAQSQYMDLGFSEKMYTVIQKLRSQCQFYGGVFSLLWHNTSLVSNESRDLFVQIVKS